MSQILGVLELVGVEVETKTLFQVIFSPWDSFLDIYLYQIYIYIICVCVYNTCTNIYIFVMYIFNIITVDDIVYLGCKVIEL